MAQEVTVLAPHKLNFVNHYKLTEQLAKRHQCNIATGFVSYVDLQKFLPVIEWCDGEDEYDCPFYLLHKKILNPKFEHAKLILEDYMYRWLFEKLGDKAGEYSEFKKHWTDDAGKNNEIIKSFVDEGYYGRFYMKHQDYLVFIYKESISPSTQHDRLGYTRWSDFIEMIFNDYENEYYSNENLIAYINDNRKIIQKHGGNMAYYLCTQSDILGIGGIGEMEELNMNWSDIENAINNRVNETGVINLRKVLFSEKYRNSIVEKYQERLPDKIHAFYDDFLAF